MECKSKKVQTLYAFRKQQYIESVLPGKTVYESQLKARWAWPGNPLRPAGDYPPIAKPAWVSELTQPDPWFLYSELNDCEDVEILIVDGGWGHFLTVTGLIWDDVNNDKLINGGAAAETGWLHYIDPCTGLAGVSQIGGQIVAGDPLRVNYGAFPNAELIMTVSESPIPEPGSLMILAMGGAILLIWRSRQSAHR